jgi:transcriptional regulator with XRE-family HTH domain
MVQSSGGAKALAQRLKILRRSAGLTQNDLAQALGWSQSRVSKVESGAVRISVDDVRRWAEICEPAGQVDLGALLILSEAAEREPQIWADRFEADSADSQTDYDLLTRQSTRIRNFEVAVVPGLLQTREYAWHIAQRIWDLYSNPPSQLSSFVTARMDRQSVLEEPGRRFEFLICEAALWSAPCPRPVLKEQIEHLLSLMTAGREHSVTDESALQIGILPREASTSLPLVNPVILYDRVAVVETLVSETIHRGEQAEVYMKALDWLSRDAVFGSAAHELLVARLGRLGSRPTGD